MNDRNERKVVVVDGRDTTNITGMVIGIIAVVALILVLVLALNRGGESDDRDDGEVTVPTTITQDY